MTPCELFVIGTTTNVKIKNYYLHLAGGYTFLLPILASPVFVREGPESSSREVTVLAAKEEVYAGDFRRGLHTATAYHPHRGGLDQQAQAHRVKGLRDASLRLI